MNIHSEIDDSETTPHPPYFPVPRWLGRRNTVKAWPFMTAKHTIPGIIAQTLTLFNTVILGMLYQYKIIFYTSKIWVKKHENICLEDRALNIWLETRHWGMLNVLWLITPSGNKLLNECHKTWGMPTEENARLFSISSSKVISAGIWMVSKYPDTLIHSEENAVPF